ncbi:hypothetical protein KPATCC21470_2585 [Kitasatospora purpeofusca]
MPPGPAGSTVIVGRRGLRPPRAPARRRALGNEEAEEP